MLGTGVSNSVAPVWGTTLGEVVNDYSNPSAPNGVQWTCVYLLSANSSNPVLRIWPWPDQAYLMTAVYQNKIPVPATAGTSNYWTTDAEAMIRWRTEGLLRKNLFHEPDDDWQRDFSTAQDEFNVQSGRVRQTSGTGRAKACYL